jgi:hypothetical protein
MGYIHTGPSVVYQSSICGPACGFLVQISYLQVYLLAPVGTLYCTVHISLSGAISWATYGPTDGLSCGLPVAFAMNLDLSLLLGLNLLVHLVVKSLAVD